MKIALTGITGNMGIQALNECLKIPNTEYKLLVLPKDKRLKKIRKQHKKDLNRIEFVFGSLANADVCKRLIDGVSYVVNMAAVIPPKSDQHPEWAIECNEVGAKTLVDAIEQANPQPKFVHISTMALYGHRNEKHLWGRVGDPLLISPFDIYSLTKMRGEYAVLESNIAYKTVIRQTAMLHSNMLSDNMSDGLMFHTCFNAPLEWSTAEDSGLLIANIIRQDMQQDLGSKFWGKVFNLGGGHANCVTGYDVLDDGFEIIGGSVKNFFEPRFNATRNFHGVWFYDSQELNDLFHYQRQTTADFWKQFKKTHGYMKLGKAVPHGLIKRLAIMRLFGNSNSAVYWYKHDDEAKLIAYFGGKAEYESLGKKWDNFALLKYNQGPLNAQLDYEALRTRQNAVLPNIGYDPTQEVTLDTLRQVAEMHGGKLISQNGNVSDSLEWENSDGERFVSKGTTVLAGHWRNPSYSKYCWDFDRLAKKDKIYADVWYDSHATDEDNYYYYDEKFNAKYNKI
ncbi:MAG: NAD-dependent epimerase/dehydratase family protein [Clostridia bacterium]|nr:NAD-dependent epimerase/dehydratase family protein [Clostridia bacterium]